MRGERVVYYMNLYIILSQPINSDTEEKVEDCILEFFHEYKSPLGLVGVFPYDPILREMSMDIGDQPIENVEESLEKWIETRLGFTPEGYLITDHSGIEELSEAERVDHVRHKLLYLLGSIRRLNHSLDSDKLRQVEFLLAGVATETSDLLPTEATLATDHSMEEAWSDQIDDFWENL